MAGKELVGVVDGDELRRLADVLGEIGGRQPYRVTVWLDELDGGVKFKLDERGWTPAIGRLVRR